METADVTRKLKIFCPTHQSVFEVEAKPQITCEIREHSLSNGFPKSEYWEYCCDCQTFSPSDFGTGGKAKAACPHCERAITRRFLCDECKITAYDSDTETKGKIYSLNATDGILPNCVGCQKSFTASKIYQHKCPDTESLFFTNRKDCPFCLKPVLSQNAPPKTVEPIPNDKSAIRHSENQPASTQCPNCGHWGRADRAVCGKCGVWQISSGAGITAGTAIPKTQLLGSICPNCGRANDTDSIFCVNCGQALKAVQQPETVVYPGINPNTFSGPPPPPEFQPPTPTPKSNLVYFVTFIGIIFFGFVIWIAVNVNRETTRNSNSVTNSTNNNSSNNTVKPNLTEVNTNKTTSDTSSSVIGQTGRLTTNVNIRSASNKFSQITGTHYDTARVKVLDTDSYYADDGEYVTWYRVKVLENGYDYATGNGTGNNWERDGNFGWMEADMEGWMNSKFITLD